MSTERPLPLDRVYLLNPGQKLDIGDRTLRCFRPPLFDSPATTGFYDDRSGRVQLRLFGAPLPSADLATASRPRRPHRRPARRAAAVGHRRQPLGARGRPKSVTRKRAGRCRRSTPDVTLSSHLPPAHGVGAELARTARRGPQRPGFVGPDQAALEQMLASFEPGDRRRLRRPRRRRAGRGCRRAAAGASWCRPAPSGSWRRRTSAARRAGGGAPTASRRHAEPRLSPTLNACGCDTRRMVAERLLGQLRDLSRSRRRRGRCSRRRAGRAAPSGGRGCTGYRLSTTYAVSPRITSRSSSQDVSGVRCDPAERARRAGQGRRSPSSSDALGRRPSGGASRDAPGRRDRSLALTAP